MKRVTPLNVMAALGILAAYGGLHSTPKPPRIYTSADEERQAKAEAKRQRKLAKRRGEG